MYWLLASHHRPPTTRRPHPHSTISPHNTPPYPLSITTTLNHHHPFKPSPLPYTITTPLHHHDPFYPIIPHQMSSNKQDVFLFKLTTIPHTLQPSTFIHTYPHHSIFIQTKAFFQPINFPHCHFPQP